MGEDPRFWKAVQYNHITSGGALGVEFFFVLSGIVMLLAHWNDQGVPASVPQYAWKRFRRIYPLYWVVLAFVALPYFLNPHFGVGSEVSPWVFLSSILLFHIHSMDTTVHVAWTLFHEVLFYGFFSLVLLRRVPGYVILGLWMLISMATLLWQPDNAWLREFFFSPLNAFFGMGMLVTWMLKIKPAVRWPMLFIVIGAWLIAVSLTSSAVLGKPNLLISYIAAVGSAALMLGLMELERRERLQVPAWLLVLGDASYAIYLVHFAVLSVGARLLWKISKGDGPLWLWFTVNCLIALTFGFIVHFTLERWLLRRIPAARRNRVQPYSTSSV